MGKLKDTKKAILGEQDEERGYMRESSMNKINNLKIHRDKIAQRNIVRAKPLKPHNHNEEDDDISVLTLIILFIIAILLILLPYILIHRNTGSTPNVENMSNIQETDLDAPPGSFKECVDYIDFGNQSSEKMHQEISGWSHPTGYISSTYKAADRIMEDGITARDFAGKAAVILDIPHANESKELTLKLNLWDNSYNIANEIGKSKIKPTKVFVSDNGYDWRFIGEFTLGGENRWKTYELKITNPSKFRNTVYVKIDDSANHIKGTGKYGLNMNWICIDRG